MILWHGTNNSASCIQFYGLIIVHYHQSYIKLLLIVVILHT